MLSYKIQGLDDLLKKTKPAILNQPLRDFFNRVAITVQSKAREDAPVDTGHLRNSIMTEVDSNTPPKFAKVGFLNGKYGSPLFFKARAMEFGTGRQGDPAVSHAPFHAPPGGALDTWARRHGFANGWAVAAAIARNGGLKPRPFLRPALKNSVGAIRGFLNQLRDDIKRAWDR